jgi:hypothetical protein
MKFKKSRIKQIISEELKEAFGDDTFGDSDNEDTKVDFDVDELMRRQKEYLRRTREEYIKFQGAMLQSLRVAYQVTYDMELARLKDEGAPNPEEAAEKLAQQEYDKSVKELNTQVDDLEREIAGD